MKGGRLLLPSKILVIWIIQASQNQIQQAPKLFNLLYESQIIYPHCKENQQGIGINHHLKFMLQVGDDGDLKNCKVRR